MATDTKLQTHQNKEFVKDLANLIAEVQNVRYKFLAIYVPNEKASEDMDQILSMALKTLMLGMDLTKLNYPTVH